MRDLTHREAALLLRLLEGDAPGMAALREQVPAVRIVEPWAPTSASLRLSVVGPAATSSLPDGPVPVEGWAYDSVGRPTGTVLLGVKDGCLSDVEFGWVTDEPPTELPTADSVRLA